MNSNTNTLILGIPAHGAGYKPFGGWAYCEGNHSEIVQMHTRDRDNLDCPICGSVMTSGKWSSKHDQLLQDVDTYLRAMSEKYSDFDLTEIADVWMEIKDDWAVVMVDCKTTEAAAKLAYFGLGDSQGYGIFTESYNLYRAMLTRDIER